MFNLLIVDDEVYAVEGLRAGVPWVSLGFDGIYEAYNIQDAREIIERHRIDLVICDIEMPGGDGFELLEWIRKHAPHLVTLFLTCHAEFHYAQRAIQLGSHDYLLKPVDFGELAFKIVKITDSINEEREWEKAQQTAQTFWATKKPLLVERFWQDVLASRISAAPEPIRKALQEFAVPFDPSSMDVLPTLISVEQWTQVLNERDEELMEYAIRKVAEEIILEGASGCAVQDSSGANILLQYGIRDRRLAQEELVRRCETFIAYCRDHFYCKLSCYIGEYVSIERIKGVYESLLKTEHDNITKSQAVHLYKSRGEEAPRHSAVDLSEWPALIEQGDEKALRERIHGSLSAFKFQGGGVETLQIYYHSVLQTIYSVLHKRGKTVQEVFSGAEALASSSPPKTIQHMEEWSLSVMASVLQYVRSEEDSIVRKVKAYIERHLDERIERTELAQLVHLNPAYLSRLFKKETGESLTDYIQAQKMKLSRDLLRGSSKPISEIALIAGYSNLSYFSKAFKKQYNVSPMAYRKGSA